MCMSFGYTKQLVVTKIVDTDRLTVNCLATGIALCMLEAEQANCKVCYLS